MRKTALALLFCFYSLCGMSFSQTSIYSDSAARGFALAISKLTSPALEERKRIRCELQRTGYSNVLMDVLANDGLSAMLSYFKVTWHIDFSMSHRPIIIQIPIVEGQGKTYDVALSDDWTFPADPWKKK